VGRIRQPTGRTDTPVGDFRFVDIETLVVNCRKTGSSAYGTVNIKNIAATAADEVMVVIADAIFKQGRRADGLDATNDAGIGQNAQGVINRLTRD